MFKCSPEIATRRCVVITSVNHEPLYKIENDCATGSVTVKEWVGGRLLAEESEARVLLARGKRMMQYGALIVLDHGRRCIYVGASKGGTMYYWTPTSTIDALHEEMGECFCFDGETPVLLDEAMYLPRFPHGTLKLPYAYFYSTNVETGVPYAYMLEQAHCVTQLKLTNTLTDIMYVGPPPGAE